MGTQPFVANGKLPSGTNVKLPKSAATLTRGEYTPKLPLLRLSAAERLRRLEEAKVFLSQHLAAGPQPARVLLNAAAKAGIAERTLHRAKDLLMVTTEREGGYAGHGHWVWYPPATTALSSAHAGGREAAPVAPHRR
jgi:hypothetical protein